VADSHAFELTVSQAALHGLAQSIIARLAPESEPVSPADIRGLAHDNRPSELRLSLVFPSDPALAALAAEHPEQVVRPGSVALAHVFVTAVPRGDNLDVCFFCTSRALATAMRESGEVRLFFGSLRKHATDGRVREVNEWHESTLL